MCAINPKRQMTFVLSVYTAHEMTDEQWDEAVMKRVLDAEIKLNEDGLLRWHVAQQTVGCQHSWAHPGTSRTPTHCVKCGIKYADWRKAQGYK